MEQVGQQRAAAGLIEKCTRVEELSHEPGGQLVHRELHVAAHEPGALALVEVLDRVVADLVERERHPPVGAHRLQVAEELEHHGLGVLGTRQSVGDVAQIELRHGVSSLGPGGS
jgi:hypothetical protein